MRNEHERRSNSNRPGGRRKTAHDGDVPPHIDRRVGGGLTGRRSTDPRPDAASSASPSQAQTTRRDSRNEARR